MKKKFLTKTLILPCLLFAMANAYEGEEYYSIAINDLSDGKTSFTSMFLGADAGLNASASGIRNVGVGMQALQNNTDGDRNTAIGYRSLKSNTTGGYNTAIGELSLFKNSSGVYNVAVGGKALFANTTGNQNVALGVSSLRGNSIGYENIAIGYKALSKNTTGAYNTANGHSVLNNNTIGSKNTAFGYKAGYSASTESGNVFIGYKAGYYAVASNKLFIENSDSDTPLIGGDFATDKVTINGDLIVAGTITELSDSRLKKDVKTLTNAIEKVNLLRGVSYEYKDDNSSSIGLIAQEVEKVLPELVSENEQGYKGVQYQNIVAVLIEAIKAQDKQIQSLLALHKGELKPHKH